MKNNKPDIFKELIRKKLGRDMPKPSEKDNEIWQFVVSEISSTEKRNKPSYYWYAIAASVLLVVGVFIALQLDTTPKKETEFISHTEKEISDSIVPTISTPQARPAEKDNSEEITRAKPAEETALAEQSVPGTKTIQSSETLLNHQLPDGSQLTLNKNTSVEVENNFTNNRSLRIKGEAYFEVQSDKNNPFTVYFDACKLEVVGTKFVIRNMDDSDLKEVTVMEGLVKVYDNRNPKGIAVKKGQQLIISREKSTLNKVETEHYLSWKTGVLNFNNTPLEEVVLVLSRHLNQKILLDSGVKGCKFTGDLSDLSASNALMTLCVTNELKTDTLNHKIILTGQSCD